MMKLVITNIQTNPFTKAPVLITITIFNDAGVKLFEIPSVTKLLFSGDLEIGQELVLIPKEIITKD